MSIIHYVNTTSKVERGLSRIQHIFSNRTHMIRSSGIRRLFDIAIQMEDVISLGIGEPDFTTPVHVKEAAKRAIDEGYTHYTPNAGFPDLREAVSEKVAEENSLRYSSDEVIICDGGCTGTILLAMLALVNPDDEVIISDPGFVVYEAVVRIVGALPRLVPVREESGFRLLPQDVEKAISPKTKAIILNSPSNPTGGVQLKEDFAEIAALARQHNLYVISDEVYEKLVYDGSKHYSIAAFKGMRDRTVTVNSFSKTYAMTGWRIGYAVADQEIVDQMVRLQQYTMVHAPAISQRAALAALSGPQDFVHEMVEAFDERRRFFVKRLNEIHGFHCSMPKGAFYVFPNIEEFGRSSTKLAQFLLEHCSVAGVPGITFGKQGEGYLRLSYAQNLNRLEEACNRIEKTVSKLT